MELNLQQEVKYPADNISDQEFDILERAKKANPFWFAVMMWCAQVMIDRNKKYTGGRHPYFNFADVASKATDRRGRVITMADVFAIYVAMKQSRAAATPGQDFADESSTDTEIDMINYAFIEAGAVLGGLITESVLEDDAHRWEDEGGQNNS